MNITATRITPERERELVKKLVDLLSSRYDAGDLYDILRHGIGMDHGDMEALGFQLRDYYEEVEVTWHTKKYPDRPRSIT